LPAADVFHAVWAGTGAARDEVAAVLRLLKLEYGIEPGFFRPYDSLDWLLAAVQADGPLSGATNEVRAGDRQLQLGSYLQGRCSAHGISMPRNLSTLGEFIGACSGLAAT
jgi:hypothetical protein